MIFDELRHIDLYYRFSKPLKESFEVLRCKKFSFRDQQTCKIGAEGIYAIPQEYSPIKKEDRCIECHHRYIDIQVMVDGIEYLGYANKNTLHCSGYDEEHDTEQLTGALTFLPFSKNYFTVLFPQDAHMPGVKAAGSTHTVKKVVIKVPVELWE